MLLFCKKPESGNKMVDVGGVLKYAKYRVTVTNDADLKNWLATLEKAEEVTVLEESKVKMPKGKDISVSKIRLSDDSMGFLESSHLGNEPLVFVKKTKAYIRPSPLVKVQGEVPEGTIGFVIEQKDGWTQVYIGKVGGTWITSQWVEDECYSKEKNLLIDAKQYENAMSLINDKKDEAEKILNDLKENARTEQFQNLAEKILSPDNGIEEKIPSEKP